MIVCLSVTGVNPGPRLEHLSGGVGDIDPGGQGVARFKACRPDQGLRRPADLVKIQVSGLLPVWFESPSASLSND